MSFVKITPDLLDIVSLELHPNYQYASSSAPGIGETGTVNVKPRTDRVLKDIYKLQAAVDADGDGVYESSENLEFHLNELKTTAADESLTDIAGAMDEYMALVNNRDLSSRNDKDMGVFRFDPPFFFKDNTVVKNVIKNSLMKSYAIDYDNSEFSFTNYNSLNFFTASSVPSDSVLMYPTPSDAGATIANGRYTPQAAFSTDFYINPRYQNDADDVGFKAGTILHLSSTLAVSLVTGSSKDENGIANKFRIMLQLSHSADISPSSVDLSIANNERTYPNDLIFLSDDNSLMLNNWHHVTTRWGTESINMGSGSIDIDGNRYYFNVPSASIAPDISSATVGDTSVLFVGNYYEGVNNDVLPSDGVTVSNSEISRFFYGDFDTGVMFEDGLTWADDSYSSRQSPFPTTTTEMDSSKYSFDHPLNAEIHELKIFSKYLSNDEVTSLTTKQASSLSSDLMFYLPPSFSKFTNEREVLVTPFQKITTTTDDPFNIAYSFGIGGHLINLENFTREFKYGIYPRLFNLTGSTIDTTVTEETLANEFVYATGSFRKRNLTILPCDNGLFTPHFQHLHSGSLSEEFNYIHPMEKFVNSFGAVDLSKVTLENLVAESTLFPGLIQSDNSTILDEIMGSSPENPGTSPGSVLTIFQRTRDNDSNEVTVFDISNLTFGNYIEPETFSIIDTQLTGSAGKVKITLKDNGRGSLYRADCLTPHAKWSNVGNIFYNEGLVITQHPSIALFGVDEHAISFKGSQNIHILTVDTPCASYQINSSSNPSYLPISASFDVNTDNNNFVYISGLNFHDENLNVIMRTNFTQPIKKKEEDEYVFRTKMDF